MLKLLEGWGGTLADGTKCISVMRRCVCLETGGETYGLNMLHSNVKLTRDDVRWLIFIVNVIGCRMT